MTPVSQEVCDDRSDRVRTELKEINKKLGDIHDHLLGSATQLGAFAKLQILWFGGVTVFCAVAFRLGQWLWEMIVMRHIG